MTAMAHSADAWRAGTRRQGHDGPVPGTAADRSSAVLSGARTVRSWPLLVLAAPAAVFVACVGLGDRESELAFDPCQDEYDGSSAC